ncbi:MAG TPA: GNAT family N-acetyltransferase [Anaerolineales bacterium]|nr:GNAT family N-acetyltransferase [Anaerolineales bacterium]
MNIRQANSSDSLLLSSLCMDVQRLHAGNQPDFFKMPQRDDFVVAFFDEMLADPKNSLFVAEENGEPLGYVFCKLMERRETPSTFALRYLLVDQISVRPTVQGKGVGVALIERAVALARELNVPKIQLDSWGFNTGAHAFFEKMGFEKFNHRFWRNLD